jgi:hypothetical protein
LEFGALKIDGATAHLHKSNYVNMSSNATPLKNCSHSVESCCPVAAQLRDISGNYGKYFDETIYSDDGLSRRYDISSFKKGDGRTWITVNGTEVPLSVLSEYLYDVEEDDHLDNLQKERNWELVRLSVLSSSLTAFLVLAIALYTYHIIKGIHSM